MFRSLCSKSTCTELVFILLQNISQGQVFLCIYKCGFFLWNQGAGNGTHFFKVLSPTTGLQVSLYVQICA